MRPLLLCLCLLLARSCGQLKDAEEIFPAVTQSASLSSSPSPLPLGDLASYKEQLLSGAPPTLPSLEPPPPSLPVASGLASASAPSVASSASAPEPPPPVAAAAAAAAAAAESHVLVTEPEADTLQQRTNFAAQAAGAVIMSSAPEWTGVSSLLTNDLDTYALSKCDAKKWVILGLSEDVMVDSIVISNEEKYSSSVQTLRVLGSQKYPATEWIVLGNFTAENRLGEQTFPLEVKTWVRYLKITWLAHYGHEFYCTWTRIKVHGSTMLEELQSNMISSDAEVLAAREKIEAHKGHNATALAAAAAAAAAASASASAAAASAAAAATAASAASAAASSSPSPWEAAGSGEGAATPPLAGSPAALPPHSEAAAPTVPPAALQDAAELERLLTASPSATPGTAGEEAASSAAAAAAAPVASPPVPGVQSAAEATPNSQLGAWDQEGALLLQALNSTRDLEYFNVTPENLDTREERIAELEALQCLATEWEDIGRAGNASGKARSGQLAPSKGGSASEAAAAAAPGSSTLQPLMPGEQLHALLLSASPAPAAAAAEPSPDLLATFSSLGSIYARREGALPSTFASPSSSTANTANVFKTLTRKLKDLEIDSSVTQSYLNEMHSLYSSALSTLAVELATVKAGLKNVSEGAGAWGCEAAAAALECPSRAGTVGASGCPANSSSISTLVVDAAQLQSLSGSAGESSTTLVGGSSAASLPPPSPTTTAANSSGLQLIEASALESLTSEIKGLSASVVRMESRQLALALHILRMLSEGGVSASLSSTTGSIVRHDDAELMHAHAQAQAQAQAHAHPLPAAPTAAPQAADAAAAPLHPPTSPEREGSSSSSNLSALLSASTPAQPSALASALQLSGLDGPLRLLRRNLVSLLSPLVTVVLLPGHPGNGSGPSGPSMALEASMEAMQRQLAALQGSLHLTLLIAALAVSLSCLLSLCMCCACCCCGGRRLAAKGRAQTTLAPAPAPVPGPATNPGSPGEPQLPPNATLKGSA